MALYRGLQNLTINQSRLDARLPQHSPHILYRNVMRENQRSEAVAGNMCRKGFVEPETNLYQMKVEVCLLVAYLLRKALGKRQMDVISLLKPRFIEGGIKNGHKKNALEKVWNEMEHKSMYAFNKSHAVCYTWLTYQMAYLKANYPEEFKQVIDKSKNE